MPAEPRIVPVPCPFGTSGMVIFVYYVDAPQPALIDTGVAASPTADIEPALNALGLSLKNVRWILATHGHWDHIGGAHKARGMAADGVQVALHEADGELLQLRRSHMRPDGYQGLRFRYLDDPEAMARHDAMLMENLSGELAADRELKGGERINLGGDITFEAVHTPGHSPGSVSFVLDGPNWAFTGDAVQVAGGSAGGFPLYTDPAAYRASQRKLLEDVRPSRLYMGHHFRMLDGTALEPPVEGPLAQQALRESLEMDARTTSAIANVTNFAADAPSAHTLRPAVEALGFDGQRPMLWPGSLFVTLHGYLVQAAAPA